MNTRFTSLILSRDGRAVELLMLWDPSSTITLKARLSWELGIDYISIWNEQDKKIIRIMTKDIQSLTFKGHCSNPGPKSLTPPSDISSLEGQNIMELNEASEVISSDQFILYWRRLRARGEET